MRSLDNFSYQNDLFMVEDINLSAIALEVGTPFYCYSASTIENRFYKLANALSAPPSNICYSVKANSNQAVLAILANLGSGADVVSEGELIRAIKAGIKPENIVFSGVGKTESELALAIDKKILQINIESEAELEQLTYIAKEKGETVPIAIRVNPNIDAESHDKISTGRQHDKFGIEFDKVEYVFSEAAKSKNVSPIGLAIHIGSQLTSLEPLRSAFVRLRAIANNLRKNGFTIERIDVGGGLGIQYDNTEIPNATQYGNLVHELFDDLGCDLIYEPGRYIVGNAGVLVTKAIYIKYGPSRNFIVVDAAMNDLLRPSLYGAKHEIVPVTKPKLDIKENKQNMFDIVGPVCETGDTLATNLELSFIKSGDLLAILSAGAYGAVMSSSYNSRPIIPEVMVKKQNFSLIRNRINLETLLKYESVPSWINK